ncbi:MAG: hypothetical protein NT022_03830 [Deltaproteobacteria bacterium]|nr:hypothetical protein [Deltaproteobacteria bacterium]
MHHLDRRKLIEEYIDKSLFQFKEGLMELFDYRKTRIFTQV